jgi:PPP family 3-phenylpropionic acid transporter
MGLTLTAATISEIPIFLYSQRFLKRWSPSFLLAVSIFFTALRAFGYIAISAPWQVLLVSLLHGPTFALMWIAGVAYANKVAPPGLGATAQGVFTGLVMGLGSALGAFTGGFLYDTYGPIATFYFAGGACLIVAAIFSFANRKSFFRQLQVARR